MPPILHRPASFFTGRYTNRVTKAHYVHRTGEAKNFDWGGEEDKMKKFVTFLLTFFGDTMAMTSLK